MTSEFVPEGIEEESAKAARRSSELASAYALHQSQNNGSDKDVADSFLSANKRLIDLQVAYFEEEKGLEKRAAARKGISDILRIVAQCAFIVIGLAIAAGLVAMWGDAILSKAVVVDEFESPGSLAQNGLSGTVVAGKVLDELLKIQDGTKFSAAQQQIKDAWSSSIEIKVPEAGISIDQINNALHRTFGHDTHIDGALTETSTGTLQLSIRGDRIPPTTFEGGRDDIDALTRKAAEYVYGYAQPVLFGSYLVAANRQGNAIAFIRSAYPRATDADRPVLANLWGEALLMQDQAGQAAERFRFATSIDPHYWRAWNNLIGVLPQTEGEEAAYETGLKMAAEARTLPSGLQPTLYDQTNFAEMTLDPGAVIAGLLADRKLAQREGAQYDASSWIAEQEAIRHDWTAVYLYLAESPSEDVTTSFDVDALPGYQAMDAGDYKLAIAKLEAALVSWHGSAQLQAFFPDFECNLGHAYAEAGQVAQALPLLQDRRFVSCRAFMADAIDRSGQWNAAQEAYRAAEAAAPKLAFAYYCEGLAHVRHGNPAHALQLYETAHRLSPRWAEPLKATGDVLASQGKWNEAADAYSRALKWAPAWAELKKAQEQASAKLASR